MSELQLLTMGMSDRVFLCVFIRKYMCGVLVLCEGIKNCIGVRLVCLFQYISFSSLLMFWMRVVV